VTSGTSNASAGLLGAEADLARAQAAYAQAQNSDLAYAHANVAKAQANAQLAQADLERAAPCRRKIEMSPRAQSRDDTPRRRTHLLRNGMSAKRLGEGEGVKGRSRLAGARSAALEALVLTQHNASAVRPSGLGVSRGRSRAAARLRPRRRGPDR